jgi:glutathione-regulated potassium-efflux system ancillary protein KefG
MRVLVLFAHPSLEHSRVHARLLAAPRETPGITLRDLYELYPEQDIDPRAEQEALLAHDVIVFQHPLYWYSVPPLLRQWQDLVLQHGWAYGHGGEALKGKLALHVISAGGPAAAYQAGGFNGATIGDFLLPLAQTARLCRMRWLPPYVVHGTHRLDEAGLASHVAAYRTLLTALRDERLDLEAAAALSHLHDHLDALVRTRTQEPH